MALAGIIRVRARPAAGRLGGGAPRRRVKREPSPIAGVRGARGQRRPHRAPPLAFHRESRPHHGCLFNTVGEVGYSGVRIGMSDVYYVLSEVRVSIQSPTRGCVRLLDRDRESDRVIYMWLCIWPAKYK